MIDVIGALSELGIDFKQDGKNVGSNDVNVDCPFCGHEKHLGISKSCQVNCWVCAFEGLEWRPSIVYVLSLLSGYDFDHIKSVLKEYGWSEGEFSNEIEREKPSKCYLPKEAKPITPGSEAYSYLISRGFNMNHVSHFNLLYAESGYYEKRIIVPIYIEYELASFVARSYDGRHPRYKNASLMNSVKRIKGLLYNYDDVAEYHMDRAFLLEGVTDVWAMGEDSMAVFRSDLSALQRRLILSAGIKELIIVFDPKATSRAYAAACNLSPFIKKIKVVRLDDKDDVAEIGRDKVIKKADGTPYFRG